jgi:hypothetical protein
MLPQRTIIFTINGIESDPSNLHGWTDDFVTSLNVNSPDWVQVEKFEYLVRVWNRWFKQGGLAKELIAKIKYYLEAGYRVVLVGHSNGCDLIVRALKEVRADSIHLFAAAAWEKDFVAAIEEKMVRKIHLYGSPDDYALKTASLTGRFLKFISFGKLGYGSMGLKNALAERYPDIVTDHSIKGYGHSTWFVKGPHYDYTIALLIRNEKQDRAEEVEEKI